MGELKELLNPGEKYMNDDTWKALLKEIDQNGYQQVIINYLSSSVTNNAFSRYPILSSKRSF